MIDALIQGRIFGQPTQKQSAKGSAYYLAKLKTTDGEGDHHLVNVITFSATVGQTLLALDEGDTIALSGPLKVGTWTDREGNTRPSVSMTAQVAISPYHVTRKRAQVAAKGQGEDGPPQAAPASPSPSPSHRPGPPPADDHGDDFGDAGHGWPDR